MSNVNFTCPHCSFSKQLPASAEGMKGNCPSCNAVVTISAHTPAPRTGDGGSGWRPWQTVLVVGLPCLQIFLIAAAFVAIFLVGMALEGVERFFEGVERFFEGVEEWWKGVEEWSRRH